MGFIKLKSSALSQADDVLRVLVLTALHVTRTDITRAIAGAGRPVPYAPTFISIAT